MTIKQNAEAIVEECERQENLVSIIEELEKKDIGQINLSRYLSQGYSSNIDVYIGERYISKESLDKINQFVIGICKDSLKSK